MAAPATTPARAQVVAAARSMEFPQALATRATQEMLARQALAATPVTLATQEILGVRARTATTGLRVPRAAVLEAGAPEV